MWDTRAAIRRAREVPRMLVRQGQHGARALVARSDRPATDTAR